MEDQAVKKEFRLSIIGAIGILLLYNIILSIIFRIPLIEIFINHDFMTHQLYSSVVMILCDIISYILAFKILMGQIRKKIKYKFKLKLAENFNYKYLICTIFLVIGYFLWYQSSIAIETEKMPMFPKSVLKHLENFQGVSTSFVSIYLYGTIILVAPIFEEIFFRGIILEGFLNRYKPLAAIIASALIFGIFHLNIPQFINASFLGGFLDLYIIKQDRWF